MSYEKPINRSAKRRYVIGIDPDKNESGFAVWDSQLNRFVRHEAMPFYLLQQTCFEFDKTDAVIWVEAGWLNDGANSYQSKTLPAGFEKWARPRREAYIFQRGCDVGINFGAGWAITHVLRANGYQLNHYRPKTRKWDAALLKQITGITARTNQDVRDAIRVAYLNR